MNAPVGHEPVVPCWGYSGGEHDLLRPMPNDVNFVEVASALSKIARFGGCNPHGVFSVAQHCAVGAHFAMDRYGCARTALAFLLHDAHEAFIGDIMTPTVDAIAALMPEGDVRAAIATLKRRWNVAICAKVEGITPHMLDQADEPWRTGTTEFEIGERIYEIDRLMCQYEARKLFGCTVGRTAPDVIGLFNLLTPWSAARAADAWLRSLDDLRKAVSA